MIHVKTFVNVTVYSQYDNNIIKKKLIEKKLIKKKRGEGRGLEVGPTCL
jgi:hypothetical protein